MALTCCLRWVLLFSIVSLCRHFFYSPLNVTHLRTVPHQHVGEGCPLGTAARRARARACVQRSLASTFTKDATSSNVILMSSFGFAFTLAPMSPCSVFVRTHSLSCFLFTIAHSRTARPSDACSVSDGVRHEQCVATVPDGRGPHLVSSILTRTLLLCSACASV